MKHSAALTLLRLMIGLTGLGAVTQGAAREQVLWDDQWRFHLGSVEGAQEPSYWDRAWRTVNLPHDWSIEGTTDPNEPAAGGGGFFPTGVGCYRKTFTAPEAWRDQRVWIEFEGVYQNADVWVNGQLLGNHPYGYTPFSYDLTPHLKFGARNTLFVRVDNSAQPNSRWYTGSGIYRHVWLHVVNPLHVASHGVFISTPEVSREKALVRAEVALHNQGNTTNAIRVEVELLDPAGRSTAVLSAEGSDRATSGDPLRLEFTLPNPRLWSPESPELYTAITRVFADDFLQDEVSSTFGIRSVHVSAAGGFELNGRPLDLVGGNVHHDNGPLGAAAFDRAEERKVEILKAAGFNAVRTAHNPPSTAFLNACDRLGMLVVDEAFDGWAKKKTRHDYATVFREWWQRDLDALVRRDRNHPSVVMWSIGNEVYERGDAAGAEIARQMRERILALDDTRPITAGINGLGKPEEWPRLDPLFASLDVAGYNYEEQRVAADHARHPSRVIALSESYQTNTFGCWAVVRDHPHVIGDFVWSGMDYLGEAGIGRVFPPGEKPSPHWEGNHYPWHGAACGDIDITGRRKPISHYRNIVWDRGETLSVAVIVPSPTGEPWNPSPWAVSPAIAGWTWAGQEGKSMQVEVYSRHDAVRLYLNGELLGQKPTSEKQQFKAVFDVIYAPGTLRAVGLDGEEEVESFELTTAGEPAAIRLEPDRDRIRANGQDLCFVEVAIVDDQGQVRPDALNLIKYRLRGPGEIVGIGSGDLTTTESYQANPRRVAQGRALVVIRSTGKPGRITLKAQSAGLKPGRIVVQAE